MYIFIIPVSSVNYACICQGTHLRCILETTRRPSFLRRVIATIEPADPRINPDTVFTPARMNGRIDEITRNVQNSTLEGFTAAK